MRFKVGQYVYMNPELAGKVDTQIGVVEGVEWHSQSGNEIVSVFWPDPKRNAEGPWWEYWLVLV